MPSLERDSNRIVIAGASSLLGAELKSLLEESRFAGWDLRLVDEVTAAGTLTEAGGEPAVILSVEEGSFERARFVFFTGSPAFALRNCASAWGAGAQVIDLTCSADEGREAPSPWFRELDQLWCTKFTPKCRAYSVFSAPAVALARLSLGLRVLGLKRLSAVVFRPVSEAGREGIEELESQTSHLLSFQSIGQTVFDTQVAFNVRDRFGEASKQNLAEARKRVVAEVEACVAGSGVMPAIQVLHVPVFYGYTFMACAEMEAGASHDAIIAECSKAGFLVTNPGDAGPSNLSVAGESEIHLAPPQADSSQPGTWWFWGAADHLRFQAASAVELAGKLVE